MQNFNITCYFEFSRSQQKRAGTLFFSNYNVFFFREINFTKNFVKMISRKNSYFGALCESYYGRLPKNCTCTRFLGITFRYAFCLQFVNFKEVHREKSFKP